MEKASPDKINTLKRRNKDISHANENNTSECMTDFRTTLREHLHTLE
jgi:hypothetical protein